MIRRHTLRTVAVAACASLLPAWPAAADETVRCGSPGFGYRYCRAYTDGRVQLVRQISRSRCRQGDSWGYDNRGVWVDRGCEAEFRVGRGSGGNNKGSNVAAGAVVGIALAAIIAASRERHKDEAVASWTIGTFRGFDPVENADVEVTIMPGGSVDGRAGDKEFTGRLENGRLDAGRYRFRVERSGNGFVATNEADSSHRVMFRRSGGY